VVSEVLSASTPALIVACLVELVGDLSEAGALCALVLDELGDRDPSISVTSRSIDRPRSAWARKGSSCSMTGLTLVLRVFALPLLSERSFGHSSHSHHGCSSFAAGVSVAIRTRDDLGGARRGGKRALSR
jgi:hypothetical protein